MYVSIANKIISLLPIHVAMHNFLPRACDVACIASTLDPSLFSAHGYHWDSLSLSLLITRH